MNGLRWAALVALLIGGSLVWWSLEDTGLPASGDNSAAPNPVTENRAAVDKAALPAAPVSESDADEPMERPAVPAAPGTRAVTPDPAAVASLRKGREQGEPRTPPLVENGSLREPPTDEELADPDLYLEYEGRKKQEVRVSFLQASERKVDELRAAIQRAESEGLPEAQLEEGREKLRRLEAMREQLLVDHPELAPAAGASDGQAVPGSP